MTRRLGQTIADSLWVVREDVAPVGEPAREESLGDVLHAQAAVRVANIAGSGVHMMQDPPAAGRIEQRIEPRVDEHGIHKHGMRLRRGESGARAKTCSGFLKLRTDLCLADAGIHSPQRL